MIYWIALRDKRGWTHHYDYFLDGIIPAHVIAMTTCVFAHDIGLCDGCTMAWHCHVIEPDTGEKYCTILFHDVVKPTWEMSKVV